MAEKVEQALSLAQIKDVQDITVENLYVPQWDGYVKIKSISKRQMREIKRASRDNANGEIDDDVLEMNIFIEGMVEPTVTEEDYEVLLDKSAAAMGLITKGILDISRMSDEAVTNEEKSFRPRRR